MVVDSSEALRCAAWAREAALDPGGTAGSPGGFAVVDWPIPWPRDVVEIAGLAEVAGVVRAHGLRLQARVPTPGRPWRATLYRRSADGPFGGYAQDDVEFGPDLVGGSDDTAAADDSSADGDAPAPERAAAGVGAALAAAVAEVLARAPGGGAAPGAGGHPGGEVLVCTHGRRDVCCGSAGTALFAELTEIPGAAAGSASVATIDGRPVGRTSHTGGHRFAPTVIVLPEGTVWAFADADLIRRVVTRTGSLSDVAPRYRGCTGLASPALQCLERAVLAEVGWPLLAATRRGEELGGDRVRLSVWGPGGDESAWEAEVVAGRTVTVPDCGRPLDEARKTETERVVRSLRRVL